MASTKKALPLPIPIKVQYKFRLWGKSGGPACLPVLPVANLVKSLCRVDAGWNAPRSVSFQGFPANDKKQSRAKRQQKTTRVNIITTKLLLSAEPNQPVRIKSGFTKPYTLSHSEYYFLLKQRSESLLLTLACLPHHYGFAEFICSNHLMFDSAEDSVLHLRHHQLQLLLFVTELMLTPSE